MKDTEFLELLNLYLDHEITAADAARLEAEVSANPARRKTYDAYCRIHRASSLVAMDFSASAGTVVAAAGKVVPFDLAQARASAQRRRVVGYLSGGLAAAACAAVAFVGFRMIVPDTRLPEGVVVAAPSLHSDAAPAARAEQVAAVAVAPAVGPRELGAAAHARPSASPAPATPFWVSSPLVLSEPKHTAAPTAVRRENDDQFAWLHNVQFSPVQARVLPEQIRFDAQPVSLQPEGRALGGRVPVPTEPAVEMAAFRFVK